MWSLSRALCKTLREPCRELLAKPLVELYVELCVGLLASNCIGLDWTEFGLKSTLFS